MQTNHEIYREHIRDKLLQEVKNKVLNHPLYLPPASLIQEPVFDYISDTWDVIYEQVRTSIHNDRIRKLNKTR